MTCEHGPSYITLSCPATTCSRSDSPYSSISIVALSLDQSVHPTRSSTTCNQCRKPTPILTFKLNSFPNSLLCTVKTSPTLWTSLLSPGTKFSRCLWSVPFVESVRGARVMLVNLFSRRLTNELVSTPGTRLKILSSCANARSNQPLLWLTG